MASTIGRLTAEDRVPVANGIRRGTLAGRQVVMSTEPLTSEVGGQARLLVSIPATPTTAGIDSRLLAIVLLALVVVCLVATLLGSVLARLVSRPLGELAAQARAIARGDFASPPSGVRSRGELGELARRVTGSVRDIDTFARYGGEEFVLILPETNLEGGLAVAEKLRLATHRTPFCAEDPDGGGSGGASPGPRTQGSR